MPRAANGAVPGQRGRPSGKISQPMTRSFLPICTVSAGSVVISPPSTLVPGRPTGCGNRCGEKAPAVTAVRPGPQTRRPQKRGTGDPRYDGDAFRASAWEGGRGGAKASCPGRPSATTSSPSSGATRFPSCPTCHWMSSGGGVFRRPAAGPSIWPARHPPISPPFTQPGGP